jgi:streptogramin lyase
VASISASSSVTARARRHDQDAGVILVSTLSKVLLVLAVIGMLGFDSLSIAATQFHVRDDAVGAALAGNVALHSTGNTEAAKRAVLKFAADNGDVVVRQGPAPDRKNGWFVELRRDARTIVAGHLPKISTYVVAISSSTASDPL